MAGTVEDVMGRELVRVEEQTTLGEVARALRAGGAPCALVVGAAGRPVGLISERELVDAVAASRGPDQGVAATWMRGAFVALPRATALVPAGELLRERGERHAAVVGEGGEVIGIVALRDVLAALVDAA